MSLNPLPSLLSPLPYELDREKDKDELLERIALLRPWMQTRQALLMAGTTTSSRYYNAVRKVYGIPYSEFKKKILEIRHNPLFKENIQAVLSSLEDISPEYRPDYLSKGDFLSPLLVPELEVPVPLTERPFQAMKERPVKMPFTLGEILQYNLKHVSYYDAYRKKKRRILAMKEYDKGKSLLELRDKYDLTDEDLVWIRNKYREYKKMGINIQELSPLLTDEEVQGAWRRAEEIYKRLPPELKNIRLCPAYATNSKSDRGIQRMIAVEGSHFSRAALNVPYIQYSPPKRIQIASHSIAKLRSNIKMLHGEAPIIKASKTNKIGFDDVAGKGINLRFRLPRNREEWLKTYGGGVILTEAAAKKGEYVFTSPERVAYAADKDGFVPSGTYVKKGDYIVTKPLEGLGMGRNFFVANYEGYLIWISDPEPHKRGKKTAYWTRDYIILRRAPLRIGDKIMSRTGIKAVITDIIPGKEPEIIVNPTDAWKRIPKELEEQYKKIIQKPEKEWTEEEMHIVRKYERYWNKQKGALWKEVRDSGGWVFIMPEPGGFSCDYRTQGFKLSWTFLAGALEREDFKRIYELYLRDNELMRGILKFLHLKVVPEKDGTYRIVLDPKEPKPDEHGKVVKFKHKVLVGTEHEREYKKIYIPEFLEKNYIDPQGNVRELKMDDKMSENEKLRNYYGMRAHAFTMLTEYLLAPRYIHALEQKIVAADVPPDVVVVDKEVADMLGLEEGMEVGFRKEPVTSANGILTLKVKIDKSGKYKYAFGLNPFTAEQMPADFDGDAAVLFYPPISRKFVPKLDKKYNKLLKKWKQKRWRDEPTDEEVEAVKKDLDTLAEACRRYNLDTRALDNKAIKEYGVLRKRAFVMSPFFEQAADTSLKEINRLFDIEKVMKAERRTVSDLERMDELGKLIRQYSKQRYNDLLDIFISKTLRSDKQLYGLKLDPNKFYVDRILISQLFPEKFEKEMLKELSRKSAAEILYELDILKNMLRIYRMMADTVQSDYEKIGLKSAINNTKEAIRLREKVLKKYFG